MVPSDPAPFRQRSVHAVLFTGPGLVAAHMHSPRPSEPESPVLDSGRGRFSFVYVACVCVCENSFGGGGSDTYSEVSVFIMI